MPKAHLLAVTVISLFLGAILLIAPTKDVAAKKKVLAQTPVEQPVLEEIEVAVKKISLVSEEPKAELKLPPAPIAVKQKSQEKTRLTAQWQFVTIGKGDSLTNLFKRIGLDEQDVYRVSRAARKYKRANFKYIQPGQTLAFQIEDGDLAKLRHMRTPTKGFEYTALSNGFSIKPLRLDNAFIASSPAQVIENKKIPPPKVQSLTLPAETDPEWALYKVRRGDNLTSIFKRAGLSARDVYDVSRATKRHKLDSIRTLQPKQTFAFYVKDGSLTALRHIKSPLESVAYLRTPKGFAVEEQFIKPDIETRFVAATLNSSLFVASKKAGIPHSVIMELAHVFGGVIDFIYDPRKGDTFSVLFEEKFIKGKKIGNGKVLAARFNNQGETHVALRYIDSRGDAGYYSPEGVSMHKAFLRAPLDFTRISSNFNLRRKHPIHKMIKAHRGIDYAAPRGTPIFAAGDGRVIESGYTRANGNYIFIKHGEKYITKYLHLHKKRVKTGQRVKQRQVIGQVGSTGYATGPHLHYEFLVNGVHRNPRTILDKLPKAKSIPQQDMPRFKSSTGTLLAQLEAHDRLLAYND